MHANVVSCMWPVANYVRTCKDYMFGTSAERPALVYSEKMFKKMCVRWAWYMGRRWGVGRGRGRGEGNVDGEGARVGTLARGVPWLL